MIEIAVAAQAAFKAYTLLKAGGRQRQRNWGYVVYSQAIL